MQRIFWIILIILLQMPVAYGLTLEGGVVYTVESARKEAFEGVKYKIPVSSFKEHLRDRNFEENKSYRTNGIVDLADRRIEWFSDGSYGITYKSNRLVCYFYDKSGSLQSLSKIFSLMYPIKSYKYSAKGKLEGVILYVSQNESFIYEINGELYGHWIGNQCYDENGKKVLESY